MKKLPKADHYPKPITFQSLKRMVQEGSYFRNILSHSYIRLETHRLQNLPLPLITSILLRLMSRNRCEIIDSTGEKITVSIPWIIRLLVDFIKDFFSIPFLLKRIHSELNLLINNRDNPKSISALDLSQPPVYLRTDLIFGLSAGGSISHISGVFNNLIYFSGEPILISTDVIPSLRSGYDSLYIQPEKDFHNFKELPKIYFNFSVQKNASGFLENKEVSFIYNRYSLYNYSGLQLAQSKNIPFVLEYNGSEIWVYKNWSNALKYESIAEKIELLNLSAADLVVVVSQPLKDDAVNRGIDSDKILVNPNGVDPEVYTPKIDGSNIRRKYNLEGKTVIGFIGTFGKWHGAEVLARAFGLLIQNHPQYRDNTRLFMIGDGNTMAQAQQELETYGVTQECILTGIVPQEEGPSHLAACDLLASPHVPNPDGTPFFGSPTKLFEYMAMGKGIIASDLDQIGEVLEHDHTAWMVKPGDAESLMHGLKAMIDNPETSKRLGKAARREVVAKYTWKEHTRKIIEKLKELCPCD